MFMKSYKVLILSGLLAAGGLLAGCEKKEDPFVDRVVAPVLVVVDGAADGGGQTAEPVATQKISGSVTMSVRIYDLDKSGILNHAVGIDSIPVASLTIKLAKRDGTVLANLITDNAGKVSLTKTWAELGLATPKKDNEILLSWTGQHKGQAFIRLSRVKAVE
jgi:hypothetical protein